MPEAPGRDDPADTLGGVDPSLDTPPPATGMRRYLLTIPAHVRMHTWLPALDAFPLKLRVGTCGGRETWSTTVADTDASALLAAAGRLGITVEEVVGAWPHEAYELRMGEPGTGWTGGEQLRPETVDLVAESARRAGRTEPLDLAALLAADLGLPDPDEPADAPAPAAAGRGRGELVDRVTIVVDTDRRTIRSEFNPGPVPIELLTVTLRHACDKAIAASGAQQWEHEPNLDRDRAEPTGDNQWRPCPTPAHTCSCRSPTPTWCAGHAGTG